MMSSVELEARLSINVLQYGITDEWTEYGEIYLDVYQPELLVGFIIVILHYIKHVHVRFQQTHPYEFIIGWRK